MSNVNLIASNILFDIKKKYLVHLAMINLVREIFSFKSRKVSVFRKIQILCFLLIFISNFTFLNPRKIDLWIYNFLSPIGFFSNIINVEIAKISDKIHLLKRIKEIEYLKIENDKLKNEIYEIKQSQDRIDNIKKIKNNFHIIDNIKIVSIIKNSEKYFIAKYFNSLDLNINDLILNQNNFLIGKIISINKEFQLIKVQLIEDDRFIIPVYSNETKNIGLLNNNKKFSSCTLEFSLIENKTNLNEGELILTSPDDGLITADIKIGYLIKKNNQNCIDRNVNLIKDSLFIARNTFQNLKFE